MRRPTRRRSRGTTPTSEADTELLDDERVRSSKPYDGLLDPRDEADGERDRHRVVAARLGLERSGEAAADVRVAQRREDRRGIGGRDDGAEEQRPRATRGRRGVRGEARQDRAHDDADGAQQRRGHGHLTQPPPRGLQAALEEDRRRGRSCRPARASSASSNSIPPGPSEPSSIPSARNATSDGHARSRGAERDHDARREDRPDEEEHEPFVHGSIFSGRQEPRRGRATLRRWPRARSTRNIGRLSEIAQVAVRHGFGYFFERHRLTDVLPWTARVEQTHRAGRLRARAPPARDARRARADVRQVRPAALDPPGRRPARHRRRAAVRSRTTCARSRSREARRSWRPSSASRSSRRSSDFDEVPIAAASIGQVHRAALPNGRRGRREGAAPERAPPDRVRPRASLPGRAHRQGARPLARLHRRAGARRRVRALDPPGARLPARGAGTPTSSAATSPARSSCAVPKVYWTYSGSADADARVPRGRPARRPRLRDAVARGTRGSSPTG